jgi:hypothetical protein
VGDHKEIQEYQEPNFAKGQGSIPGDNLEEVRTVGRDLHNSAGLVLVMRPRPAAKGRLKSGSRPARCAFDSHHCEDLTGRLGALGVLPKGLRSY